MIKVIAAHFLPSETRRLSEVMSSLPLWLFQELETRDEDISVFGFGFASVPEHIVKDSCIL